jgi:hypothetical protein
MTRVTPERGTQEYKWWHAGAEAEALAIREGMTKSGADIYELVHHLASTGQSASQIAWKVARIYYSPWSRKQRLYLARKLVFRR